MGTEHEDVTREALPEAPSNLPPTPPEFSQATPPPQARTNALAIVALVSSFFVGLVGVVCGILALVQLKRDGERGRGLAIAGVVIGGLQMVVAAVVAVLIASAIAVGAAVSSASHSSTIPDFVPGGETTARCAALMSTISDWQAGMDPTSLALDPSAGLKKLAELRDDLGRAGDTIIDADLSEAVDSAAGQLDDLITAAEPFNDAPQAMTPEEIATISKKLGSTMQALKKIGAVCSIG